MSLIKGADPVCFPTEQNSFPTSILFLYGLKAKELGDNCAIARSIYSVRQTAQIDQV